MQTAVGQHIDVFPACPLTDTGTRADTNVDSFGRDGAGVGDGASMIMASIPAPSSPDGMREHAVE